MRGNSLALLLLGGIGLYALSRRQLLAHTMPVGEPVLLPSGQTLTTPQASRYEAAGVSLSLPGTYYPSGFTGESGKPGDPYLIYHI